MIDDPIYKRAYASYLEGDYEAALDDIGVCIQKYRKSMYHQRSSRTEEFSNLVFAKLLEGKIFLASGNITEAEQVYNQLKSELIGTDKTTIELKGQLYSYLAEIAKTKEDWSNYLKRVKQAKEYFIEADNYSETVDLLFDLEIYLLQEGREDKLIDLYQEILQTNKKIRSKELRRINSAKVRYQTGKILQRTDLKQATKSMKLAHKDYSKLDLTEMTAKTAIEIAKMKSNENPKESLDILRYYQKEFKDLKELKLIISIRMAITFLELGKIEEAINLSDEILSTLDKNKISKEVVDNLIDLVKYFVLFAKTDGMLVLARKGAQLAADAYDKYDDRDGKIISFVFDEISGFMQNNQLSDDSKLKLVQILSKKFRDIEINTFQPRTLHILRWISKVDSDMDPEGIYSQIISQKQQFHDLELAQVLFILGLYHLSKSQNEPAKFYLEKSKVQFENLRIKNYQINPIISNIEKQLSKL